MLICLKNGMSKIVNIFFILMDSCLFLKYFCQLFISKYRIRDGSLHIAVNSLFLKLFELLLLMLFLFSSSSKITSPKILKGFTFLEKE